MGISSCKSELLQCPLDFASKARKVSGFIPHRVFFGIPKLINLFQSQKSRGVGLAHRPQGRPLVPLGFEGFPEFGHGRTGLAAISYGDSHSAGATERLDEALDPHPAIALHALNPWKPHLSYDLERAYGSERGHQ